MVYSSPESVSANSSTGRHPHIGSSLGTQHAQHTTKTPWPRATAACAWHSRAAPEQKRPVEYGLVRGVAKDVEERRAPQVEDELRHGGKLGRQRDAACVA